MNEMEYAMVQREKVAEFARGFVLGAVLGGGFLLMLAWAAAEKLG